MAFVVNMLIVFSSTRVSLQDFFNDFRNNCFYINVFCRFPPDFLSSLRYDKSIPSEMFDSVFDERLHLYIWRGNSNKRRKESVVRQQLLGTSKADHWKVPSFG